MMRRVLVTFLVVLMVGSSVPAGLAADLPRHRDPLDFGPEQPNLVSLENMYGFIFNRTLTENFAEALHWIDVAGLVFAPQDTNVVIDRFTTLFRLEVQDLNLTRSDIEMIRGYVKHLRMDDARVGVAAALVTLGRANVTLDGMTLTARELASLLKGSPTQILNDVENLKVLIERYKTELLSLLEPEEPLIQTRLTIQVTPTEAIVGSDMVLVGMLTDGSGSGLVGREVDVLTDYNKVGGVVTDASGSFMASLSVPYVYEDHITVSAEYRPNQVDQSVYLPCASNDVEVRLIYYTPVISLSLPRTVYPGKTFNVSGSVQFDGVGVGGLGVEVHVFNSTTHFVTGSSGLFSATLSVPVGWPEGLSRLGIYTSAREVYAPSSLVSPVNVTRVPLTLSIDSSSWAVSGLPFRISGSVLLDGVPVGNCTVRLGGSVGDSVVVTGPDGRFESAVGLPFSLFTADYSFNVKAYAPEAWVSDASVGGKVFVVNMVTMIAGPVIIGGVVYYGSKRLRRPKRRVAVAPVVEEVPLTEAVPVVKTEGGPAGVREAYGSAVELVMKRTGVAPRPSETLREYLDATEGQLGAGARVFRSLTLMFERWLYGGSEVRLGVVERLLRKIRGLFS